MKPTALLSILTLAALPASDATIKWDPPQNITGDSDVNVNPDYVVTAINAGNTDGTTTTTVSGVTFGIDDGTVLSGTAYSNYDFAPNPDPAISAAYDTLLSNVRSFGVNISLSGLTVGTKYKVQIWVNDTRNDKTAARQTRFTADDPTQTITTEGYDPEQGSNQNGARYVNALLLTTVPEPSSAALLGVLFFGAGFLRRRR